MPNIFDFWAECPADARIHPQDQGIFDRRAPDTMGFDLRCLPASFAGRLRSAPVVMLYLSPGFAPSDVDEAGTIEAQARYADRRKGDRPLDGEADHLKHFLWWSARTKVFGKSEKIRERVAIMNLGAYHSEDFKAQLGVAALPSYRASLDWAQNVLFPEAIAGKRVVVCMRSARLWGLRSGTVEGESLFAPRTTPSGHMELGEMRERVIAAVQHKLDTFAT